MQSNEWKPITGAQLRAARALLRWSADDLAEKSMIGVATIRRAEGREGPLGVTAANRVRHPVRPRICRRDLRRRKRGRPGRQAEEKSHDNRTNLYRRLKVGGSRTRRNVNKLFDSARSSNCVSQFAARTKGNRKDYIGRQGLFGVRNRAFPLCGAGEIMGPVEPLKSPRNDARPPVRGRRVHRRGRHQGLHRARRLSRHCGGPC